MQPAKNPDYLRTVAQAVTGFKDALTEFLELHVFNASLARGIAPALFRRDGVLAADVAPKQAAVARAAGRASVAPPLTGVRYNVQGVGEVDPVAAWDTMLRPKPLLEPDDILNACDQMLGRLDAMIAAAEAERPPAVGAEAMHPLVWGAARGLWRDGHYRHAVATAADALVNHVKALTGRNDVSETALWQETFSNKEPAPGKPRLRWPGDVRDRDVITMNEGLRSFAPGVQMLIRNPAAHGGELTEQEALERLAALSLLARLLEDCSLDRA